MKTKLLILTLLFLVSCKSIQKNIENNRNYIPLEKEEALKKMNGYSISIPDDWYSYIEAHKKLCHSPKKLKNEGVKYNANLICMRIEPAKGKSINYIYNRTNEWLSKIFDNPSLTKNVVNSDKYGKYLIMKFGARWSKKDYTISELVFLQNDKFYTLRYASWNQYYSEFLPEALKIIETFKIDKIIKNEN